MFCVIYEFEVNPEHEKEFKEIWHQLTLRIKDDCGGLGSRLHKDNTRKNIWVAYAQWPDENTWGSQPSSIEKSTEHAELRRRMKEVCVDIGILYQLNLVDDLLKF